MTNKIPFDAELWKSGKYDVVDFEGHIAKSVVMHNIECDYPVCVIFGDDSETFTSQGKYLIDSEDPDCESNIFLIPKKRKVWIAIDAYGEYPLGTTLAYHSKEELLDNGHTENRHIIEVELPK